MMDFKRKSNIELMRIILMLFIVSGHILMLGDSLSNFNNTFDYYLSNFLRSIFVIAVNVFIIISGYFGIKLKWKKLLKLEGKVLVYTYVSLVLGIIFGIYHFSIITDIKLLFPLLTKQYWFITIYFVLCILSPYLNKFLQMITKKELESLLLTFIIIFYGIATFCYAISADQIVPDAGYGIVNFISLYCLGYYLKNYYTDKHNVKFYFFLFVITMVLLFLANQFFTKKLGFYFDSFISYNSIFVLFGSIYFFLAFKNIDLKYNYFINNVSSKCLAVYIIHMNPILSKYIFETFFKVKSLSGINILCGTILISIEIYVLCYFIDYCADIAVYSFEKLIKKMKHKISG